MTSPRVAAAWWKRKLPNDRWAQIGTASRILYDLTNTEFTVQTTDSGGNYTDRFQILAASDLTHITLYNDDVGVNGVRLDAFHESSSPANNDVPLDLRIYSELDDDVKRLIGALTWTVTEVAAGSEAATLDIKLADGNAGDATTQLTIGGDSITGTVIKDEDTMVSDSATHLVSQQSIKAYVDSQVASADTLAEVLALGNTTGGTDISVTTGDDISGAAELDLIAAGGALTLQATGDIILKPSGSAQDYNITDLGTNGISIQAQTTNTAATFALMGADDPALQNVIIRVNGRGAPQATTNVEYMDFKFKQSASRFEIETVQSGSGTARDFAIIDDSVDWLVKTAGGGIAFTGAITMSSTLGLSGALDMGSNNVTQIGAAGNSIAANALTMSNASGASNMVLTVENTSNTAAQQDAHLKIKVGGSTTLGDPIITLEIPGGESYYIAANNSDSRDTLVFGQGVVVGTTPLMTFSVIGIEGSDTPRMQWAPQNVTYSNTGVTRRFHTFRLNTITATSSTTATYTDLQSHVEFGARTWAGTAATFDKEAAIGVNMSNEGGSVTLVHNAGVRIVAPASGTPTTNAGLAVEAMTGATNNYAIDTNTGAGADQDVDIIHVDVTGDPIFSWDDTDDRFTFSHGVDLDAGSLNASGGGALTGTWTDLGSVTTVDINGGTVDAVTIGGASAGAITGTTIDATADFTVGATVITDGVITDASGLQIAANLDMATNTISNVGDNVNDWTATGIATKGSVAIGVAGSDQGTLTLAGVTSGVVTVAVAAAAGTWTMTLPTAVGSAGQQLTDAAGDGITSWAAASSLRELKTINPVLPRPQDALDVLLGTQIYTFRYKPGVGTLDSQTEYVGPIADEAPWAMHYGASIINPVNAIGYMTLGFQAVNEHVNQLENEVDRLRGQVRALTS